MLWPSRETRQPHRDDDMKATALLIICSCLISGSLGKPQFPEQEKDPNFWNAWAQRSLQKALMLQNLNKNEAKNLILFLGDGMGIPTVTAARILKGQLNGQSGEETQLAMEKFPFVSLAKVFLGYHILQYWTMY